MVNESTMSCSLLRRLIPYYHRFCLPSTTALFKIKKKDIKPNATVYGFLQSPMLTCPPISVYRFMTLFVR